MLQMNAVVETSDRHVWCPNTSPASMRYQSQAGAIVSSWAKQDELASSSTLRGVSCHIYGSLKPPVLDKYHYITHLVSDQMHTFHLDLHLLDIHFLQLWY